MMMPKLTLLGLPTNHTPFLINLEEGSENLEHYMCQSYREFAMPNFMVLFMEKQKTHFWPSVDQARCHRPNNGSQHHNTFPIIVMM
jgi:hypothetical protein